MIKITRFFYVSILCIPLFLLSYFSGSLYTLLGAYSVAAVHEIFHLLAALLLNVRVKSIILMPFGITLRLKNAVIKNPEKEILIALSGPFANLLMTAAGFFLALISKKDSISIYLFIYLNLIMFFINLLPALPLDGGRVLRGILISRIGYSQTVKIQRKITVTISVMLGILGIILLFVTRFNMSLVLVSAFLIYAMINEKKESEYTIMKELLDSKDKLKKRGIMNVAHIAADGEVPLWKVLFRFGYDKYYIITVSEHGKKTKSFTENELIEYIKCNGASEEIGTLII